MLSNEEVQKYKDLLLRRREELLKKVKKESKPADFGSDVDHGDEEADETEEFDNELATSEVFRKEVERIDAALQRIEEGSYGTCEQCGKEIPKEVLDAAPESTLCETHKQGI